jgi:sugar lactone lactonase YvrE
MSLFNINNPPVSPYPVYPSYSKVVEYDLSINARGLAFNQGILYVVCPFANSSPPSYVYKHILNSNGTVTTTPIVSNTADSTQGKLLKPYNITFDTSNNFYVACQGGTQSATLYPVVLKYDVNGNAVNFTGLNRNWFSITKGNGITIDRYNNLFVTDTSSSVSVYNSTTGNVIIQNFITGLNNPTNLRFDTSNNLFVCNYSNNNVDKYKISYQGNNIPNTINISSDASLNFISTSSIGPLNGPNDVNFDKYGYIYVASQNNNQVNYYNSFGTYIGNYNYGLNQPCNIVFDQYNNLYVANYASGSKGFILKLSYYSTNINGAMRITESIGTEGNANTASLLIEHRDMPGFSSIVFQSNPGNSDFAYIRYRDRTVDASTNWEALESARLEIGTEDNGGGATSTTSYYDALILQKNGGYVGIGLNNPQYILDVSGTIQCVNVTTTSDYRLKSDIVPLDDSYSVDQLNPVTYTMSSSKKPNIGFIAHEVQECFPELVEGEKDGKHYQSLYMSQMIPILVKEIQRLKADNTQLKSDVRYMKDILTKFCID